MVRNQVHFKIKTKFDGAIWLTPEQWDTYRRCPPVRYVRETLLKARKNVGRAICDYCHIEDDLTELQACHRIGFTVGVVDWGLTPDWVNQEHNLALAHRKVCNASLELTPGEVVERLTQLGVDYAESPAVKSGLVVVTKDQTSGKYSVSYPNR